MAKLTVGSKLPDFTYDTPYAQGKSIGETAKAVSGKTALVFLRYYGCTLCQFDIHQFKVEQAKITATGGQMLVVLQSDPAKIAAQQKPDDLPFDIICDPEQKLYKQFDIKPASSKLKMADLKTIKKLSKAKSAFEHGEYEGDELQLPAVFVVDPELDLTYVHYGKSAGDVPTPDELAGWMK